MTKDVSDNIMSYKYYGPVNGSSKDKKRSSAGLAPRYVPNVLPRLRNNKNASI